MSARHGLHVSNSALVDVPQTADTHKPVITVEVRAHWPEGVDEETLLGHLEEAARDARIDVAVHFREKRRRLRS